MTGGRAEAAVSWLEVTRGRCDRQALQDLWAAVPEPMRLSCFAESTVPAGYAGAFCHDGPWRSGVELSVLPEPMRQELAWCVFRIIELGGKIPTPGLSMLVRRLGEVVAGRVGQVPVPSLLDLSVRDWCQQIQHAVHRRTGRLPAAGGRHDEQHPAAADSHDASAGHRLRHWPVVASGPVEPGRGHPDPGA